MATLVHVSGSTPESSTLLNGINQIRSGISTLQELRGRSNQSIAGGAAGFQTVFGTDTTGSAQALHDRMETFLTDYEGGSLLVLSDLIDTVLNP